MAKFLVRVTESINHDYVIEADSVSDALDKYGHFTDEQLADLDVDGDSSWDKPWDVEQMADEEEQA